MAVTEAESKLTDKTGEFQIGNAQTALTAAETDHTIADTSETVDRSDLKTHLDALGTRINEIETLLEFHRLTLDN